jgi:hypothetical protein
MSIISDSKNMYNFKIYGIRDKVFPGKRLSEGSLENLSREDLWTTICSDVLIMNLHDRLGSFLGEDTIIMHTCDYEINDSLRAYESAESATTPCAKLEGVVKDNYIGCLFDKGKFAGVDRTKLSLDYGYPSISLDKILDVVNISDLPALSTRRMFEFTFSDSSFQVCDPRYLLRVIDTHPLNAFLLLSEDSSKKKYYKLRLEKIDPVRRQVLPQRQHPKIKISR